MTPRASDPGIADIKNEFSAAAFRRIESQFIHRLSCSHDSNLLHAFCTIRSKAKTENGLHDPEVDPTSIGELMFFPA
jgi:hypothetical protein